ncbi:MAG: site-2 protease family protein [Oscillospiraceae bacterium]|nr:site-2 protease family protein [Oscillospiraceae bacterium]
MQLFLTQILPTVLMFGLIIFVHEFGHFIAAKLNKIKVLEFALGMGPAIFKLTRKGTKYAVRLFPIGGYVSMEGEHDDSEDKGAFNRKSVPRKASVVSAGAAMNLLLGFLIMMITVIMQPGITGRTITGFVENSQSLQAGLESGDKLEKINNFGIFTEIDVIFQMDKIRSAGKTDADITVSRNGKSVRLENVPILDDEGRNNFYLGRVPKNIINVASESLLKTVSFVRMVWLSIVDLFTGRIGVEQLSGPVGVSGAVGSAVRSNISSFLVLISLISINVGIFNMLPFPALDGGRLVFLLIESVRRKPLNPKIEAAVNGAGLVLLLVLMVIITFKDVFQLIF